MSAFCWGEDVQLAHHRVLVTPAPISFQFPAGAITALIGPNGAGKTSLMRSLVGESVLHAGKIFLSSIKRPISELSPKELAEHVAIVPQEGPYPGDLRLVDFLKFAFLPKAGWLGRLPSREDPRLREILTTFGLEPLQTRPLRQLSTGERQKAFLARALLQTPRLLLLDEPTNHLDPGSIYSFWNAALKQREAWPVEILLSTHDLEFVRRACHWVCALKAGGIVFSGSVDDFWKSGGVEKVFGKVLFSASHASRD